MSILMSMVLDPQWIVGFVDGEGCFAIEASESQIQVCLSVVQSEVDINVLYALKNYFKCGAVTINRDEHDPNKSIRWQWRLKSVPEFVEILIPFFDKHKLKTKRRIEYQRVRAVALMLHKGDHFNPEKKAKMLRMAQLFRIGGRKKKLYEHSSYSRSLKREREEGLTAEELQARTDDLARLDHEFGVITDE